MRVMTFNVQHFADIKTDRIDYDAYRKAIVGFGADIIALNEVFDKGTSLPSQVRELCRGTDYHYYFGYAVTIGGNPYGNALLSRYPILSCETVPVPSQEGPSDVYLEDRCLIKAKIDVDGKALTVLVIHFGLSEEEHRRAKNAVIGNLESERCILMGDFNVTPEDGILAEIRERMSDTAEKLDAQKFSFPSDAPDRKIDYIFTSPDIRTLSAEIPTLVLSDHLPYLAEIE